MVVCHKERDEKMMTNIERNEAIKWFEARAKVAAMPGAQKMFRIAIDALIENQALRNAANGFKARAEAAISDLYIAKSCITCKRQNTGACLLETGNSACSEFVDGETPYEWIGIRNHITHENYCTSRRDKMDTEG